MKKLKTLQNKLVQLINSNFVHYFALFLIIALGFMVRLWKINNPIADWHSWRQVDTASVSRIYMDEGINVLFPKYYDISRIQTGAYNPDGLRMVEFPVFNVIHALLAKNIPILSFDVWGRLISITSAITSAIFLYLIAKYFSGRWVGLLTAFVFLFIPYNIYFTRVILPEPMAVAFAMAGIWFFITYLKKEKLIHIILSGVFIAASALLKPFTFFYGLPLLYLAIQKYGLKGIFKKKALFLFLDIAAIPFFLWRIWVNRYPNGVPHFEWAFNGDKIRFRPAFWFWIFGERIGKLVLGVWGLIPASYAILKTQKKNMFSLFFFLGVVAYTFIIATASVRHDYYQIFLIPPLSLLVAQGIYLMWTDEHLNKLISRTLAVISVFLMLVIGYVQAKDFYQINHYEIIEAGAALDKIAPKDAIVIAPYNGDTAFLYQTKRYGFPVVDRSFDEMTSEYNASYFVTVNWADPDTKYIEEHYKVIEKTNTYMIADLTQKTK